MFTFSKICSWISLNVHAFKKCSPIKKDVRNTKNKKGKRKEKLKLKTKKENTEEKTLKKNNEKEKEASKP